MQASYALSLERLAEVAARNAPPPTKRMLVIVNPYATTMSDRLKHLVVYALQGRYEVKAVDTKRQGHAIELCRDAARAGYDVVVAFGGDGTVNEAANGLAGSATPLTCLPGGGTNVFCRILGIPNDVVDATEHLLRIADEWRPRPIDLARVNGRYFLFSAGVGLDASVVERVDSHPRLKTRFGPWYYTEAAVATFMRRYLVRPPRMQVEVDGRSVRGVTAMVQNAHPYTYFGKRAIELAEGAELDSGDLAGAVLTRASPIDMPTVILRAVSHKARIVRHRRVESFSGVSELVIRSADDRPLPLQVDGDYIGDEHVVRFGVEPAGLLVVA